MNTEPFQKVREKKAKILVVTKYWEAEKTNEILKYCQKNFADIFFGLGENRVEKLKNKNCPRELVHFIGNIQSKKIAEILKNCSTIHSLQSLKHARVIQENLEKNKSLPPINVFLQIQLDSKKNSGIEPENFPFFLRSMCCFTRINILGVSGMGVKKNDFLSQKNKNSQNLKTKEAFFHFEKTKQQEFEILKKIRNEFLPHGLISAGTSQDYKIALGSGIDIVRIGSLIAPAYFPQR